MNDSNTEYLYKKYPLLYKQHSLPMSESALCWGFQCGDGWLKIIDKLSEEIVKVSPTTEATTVKEKFGKLRFYTTKDSNPDKVDKLISKAVKKSSKTCEICGEKGKPFKSTFGWLSVLCKECIEKETK